MANLKRTMEVRWRLAISVLPAVAVVAVAKTLITELDAESIELNPLYAGLVAGNIFLLGFLLAGTPFSYTVEGARAGSVEASLDPLVRLSARLPQPSG